MNSDEVTIISIAGKQNAGKTTLIKTLIPELKDRGHRVGTLKYNIKEFKIDHEGKDTNKYYHSGADSIALTSQDEIAVIKRVTDPPGISKFIAKYLNDVNIVFVEGYRGEDFPRIKIVDSRETDSNDTDNELILIKENPETKCFLPEDTNKALDFIENIIHLKRKK
ncbi:MAG: Molybdopterin-guanine dinucleotide biosynthesis adapter protein [Candidatus Scalindua arabica]|uniref:Molybdopterin-guanine dinucleotide biosynthesis adapter protein n=1 Tax=Candidatus Scalindua arabica TaxID=1127984 RepID=A0A941W445_9BACT|nr:Molybdopterin-guanine dinucleotide biosynthesis adapter protein [Candidatus Scalindua arabica]